MIRQYMRVGEIAHEFGVTPTIAGATAALMRKHPERYGEDCFLGEGKGALVRYAAFFDAHKHRTALKSGQSENLPPLDLIGAERRAGLVYTPETVDIDRITNEVKARIIAALKEA